MENTKYIHKMDMICYLKIIKNILLYIFLLCYTTYRKIGKGKSKMKNNKKINNLTNKLILAILVIIIGIIGYSFEGRNYNNNIQNINTISFDIQTIPEYTKNPYVTINNNIPSFTQEDYNLGVFENYSKLDNLGRCSVAYANICKEIMPSKDEKREAIGMIKPSGWQTVKYEGIVEGNYLYNRCHLIGYQLAGENANEKNLITGTRYMNVEGMLPFENKVADYIEKNPNNHVLYRVTPVFQGNNLLASGVQIESYSIEDNGKGICFNVYIYNVQPGIKIDYVTGKSELE